MATQVKAQLEPGVLTRGGTNRQREAVLAYVLQAPTLLLIAAIVVLPLGEAIYLSFTSTSFINPELKFVGLGNYLSILESDIFWQVVANSVVWTSLVVLFQFLVGLGAALLLNQRFYGRSVARSLIILPWVTPGIIAALDWRLMYDPNIGIINAGLAALGMRDPFIPWLADAKLALPAVIFAAIWKGSPFSIVMYLAALQGVSSELVDAARIDGANSWQRLRFVVLPEIMSVVRVTVLLTTVWTFNYFDFIYVMTQGGPGHSTDTFPTFIYKLAFQQFKLGAASAYGVVSVLLLLTFTLMYVRELQRSHALD
jgi:multiple sugar transport system permease protein